MKTMNRTCTEKRASFELSCHAVCDQLKLLNLYIKRAVAQKNSESSDDSSKASSPVSVVDTTTATTTTGT